MSDDLDFNVELNRKKVANLFDTAEDSEEIALDTTNTDIEDVWKGEPDLKNFWTDDEWSADVKPTRPTRPTIHNKVSKTENYYDSPDESKKAAKSKNSTTSEEKTPRPRPKSSFVLLNEEDDEYTEFLETYKKKPPKRDEQPSASTRPRKSANRSEAKRYAAAATVTVEEEVGDGIENVSAVLRAAVIGFMLLFLVLTAFLVYHNSVLGSQLEDANSMLTNVQSLEENLNRVQFELEATREELVALEAENNRLASLVINPPAENAENAETSYADPETPSGESATEQPTAPAAPTAPTAPNDAPNRIHTVVAGDNLSRISRQYFGNDSPATLQRIMTANNMNDPNVLTIGMQLVIPN